MLSGETATRLRLPGLSRAVDQIVAALEHCAPLAAVLHSQSVNARDQAKRVLIEQAGRKEIVVMLPRKFAERSLQRQTEPTVFRRRRVGLMGPSSAVSSDSSNRRMSSSTDFIFWM